jgi:hypothetical protein
LAENVDMKILFLLKAPFRALLSRFGLTLWAAILEADEGCIDYTVATTHLRLFTAQLATLLAVELLPEDASLPGPRER